MTKRQYEDNSRTEEAYIHPDRAKKLKLSKLATSQTSTIPVANGVSTHESTTNIDEERKELAKAHRKALKHGKKESRSRGEEENGTKDPRDSGDDDEKAKAERKALKRAKKAARKAARLNGAVSIIDSNSGTTSAAVSTPEAPDLVAYREDEKLQALPQSEIDSFASKNFLGVEDPSHQSYRPIISFEYLKFGTEDLRAPFAQFSKPTPIQAACWPYLLAGRDIVGVAETGSGKTLAFAVPCIQSLLRVGKDEGRRKRNNTIKACIVSPTRELAMQIQEQILKLANPAGLKVSLVYGGVSKDVQREMLTGTEILVATPGRLNDFIQEGAIDLSDVRYLVLDEADRMLDKGFEQEVRKIIETTPAVGRQTLMFTATWPPSVRELANTFMTHPVKVTIGDNASGELRANANITQAIEVIEEEQKQSRLIQLLKQHQSGKGSKDRILIFCLYKKEATRIEEFLRRKGFSVAGIHGDLTQAKRTESLEAFKQGRVPLLVATDVAARGLDIPSVKLVVNFTFPLTVEDYVHRIGRTGRAGDKDGRAVTFFTRNEKGLSGALINVLKAANQPVPEELLKFGSTVKKKGHEVYGAFYRDVGDMKKATKITFD